MTEKRKPTYDLEAFKAASAVALNVTGTAVRSAAALGSGRVEIVTTIQTMGPTQFYKSMTAYGDHRIWQDVYHVPSEAGDALHQVHGRRCDRVPVVVVQGERR